MRKKEKKKGEKKEKKELLKTYANGNAKFKSFF